MRWILVMFILSMFGCGDDLGDSDISGYQRLECQDNIFTTSIETQLFESFVIIPNRLPAEIYALICFDTYYNPMGTPGVYASTSNSNRQEYISYGIANVEGLTCKYPDAFSYNGSDTLITCSLESEDPMKDFFVYYKDLK